MSNSGQLGIAPHSAEQDGEKEVAGMTSRTAVPGRSMVRFSANWMSTMNVRRIS
jgi:hypothetical protein